MSSGGGGSDDGGVRQLCMPKCAQLHRSLQESLNARDRANVAQILEYYQRTRNIERLVASLNEICRTVQQREELYPLLRAVIPRNDRERFDYECYRPRSASGRRYHHTYSNKQSTKYHTTRSLPVNSPYRWNDSSRLETPPRSSSGTMSESRPKVKREKRSSTPKVVVLERDEHGGEKFGFSIRGGAEHNVGIFVSSLDEGSVGERAGLSLGDQIMEGNGMSFNDLSHKQAVEVIQQAVTLHLCVKSVGKIPGTFKSSSSYRWIDPGGKEVSPPLEYAKVNLSMREMNKSEMRLLGGDDERKVNLFVADGAQLGLKIRGGVEHGLGIFIASVDKDSGAERAGFQVGDQILDVNGKSFVDITHKEAVQVLKSAQHMVITLKDIGILPHGKQIRDETRWIREENTKTTPRSVSADATKKKTGMRKTPSFHEGMGSSQLTHHSVVDHSDDILQIKARQVLPNNEVQAFAFYLNEYRSTHLSLSSFLSALSDAFQTPAKASLFQEIRSAILPHDLEKFEEWMKNSENEVLEASLAESPENKLTNHDNYSMKSYKSATSSKNSWFGFFKRKKENTKNQDKERPNSPKHQLNHSRETDSALNNPNGTRNSTTYDDFPPPPKFITDDEHSSDKLSDSSANLLQEPWSQPTKNQSQLYGRTTSDVRFETPRLAVSDQEADSLDNLRIKSNNSDTTFRNENSALLSHRVNSNVTVSTISDDEDTIDGLYSPMSSLFPNIASSTYNRSSEVIATKDHDTGDGLYATMNNWDTSEPSDDTFITMNPLYSTVRYEDSGSYDTASHNQVKEEYKKEFQRNGGVRENTEDQMPLYAVVDKSRINKLTISAKGSTTALLETELDLPPSIPERRYTEMDVVELLGKNRKPFQNGDSGGDENTTEFLNRNCSSDLQNEDSKPEALSSGFTVNASNGEDHDNTNDFPERLRDFDKRCVVDNTRNTSSKQRLRKGRKSQSKIVQEEPNEDRKTFVVELIKHTSNLGLSITGGTDTESKEIRIKSIKSGNTVAGSCPLLKPGQIILGVDEKSLQSVTSGIAAMAIRQAFHSDKNVLKLILDNGS